MTTTTSSQENLPVLPTLPTDEVRQIMWRFADRGDLRQLVRATRGVARELVARLVADGQRDTHHWTPEKQRLLDALDEAGVTSIFADREYGGSIEGPKNLATALAAFELAWVDGGAATCLIALGLAVQPILALGSPDQKSAYLKSANGRGHPPLHPSTASRT